MSEWDKLWKQIQDSDVLGDINPSLLFEIDSSLLWKIKSEGDKLKDRVKYLDDLTDGNGEILTAKLVEIQKLEQKLEEIKKARTFIQVKRCLMNE